MTIYGKVFDKTTKETLPGAEVYFSNGAGTYLPGNEGITTDEYGNYSISGNGAYLTASYTGYQKKTYPAQPGNYDFELSPGIGLPEVVIRGKIMWPRILAILIILLVIFAIYKKMKKH